MNLTDRQKLEIIQSVLLRAEDAKQLRLISSIINNTLLTTDLEDLKWITYPYQFREIDKALEEKQRIKATLEKKSKNALKRVEDALATDGVDPNYIFNETEYTPTPTPLKIKPKKND